MNEATDPIKQANRVRTKLKQLDKQEAKTLGNVRARYAEKRNAVIAEASPEAIRVLQAAGELERTEP